MNFYETSSIMAEILNVMQTASLILVVCSIAIILFVLWHTSWARFKFLYSFSEFIYLKPKAIHKGIRKWHRTFTRLQKENLGKHELISALLEADELLGNILKELVPHHNLLFFEERLSAVGAPTFEHGSEIPKAHIIVSHIRERGDIDLSVQDLVKGLSVYHHAIRG